MTKAFRRFLLEMQSSISRLMLRKRKSRHLKVPLKTPQTALAKTINEPRTGQSNSTTPRLSLMAWSVNLRPMRRHSTPWGKKRWTSPKKRITLAMNSRIQVMRLRSLEASSRNSVAFLKALVQPWEPWLLQPVLPQLN